MITFTKEQLIASAHARIEFAEMMLAGELEPLKERTWSIELELARIALASLEAEAVMYVMVGEDFDSDATSVSKAVVDGWVDEWNQMGEHSFRTVPLYATPPAPTVPNECPTEIRELMASYSDALFDDEDAQVIWNACRAAMLQGADSELQRKAAIHDALCENYSIESLADFVDWQRNHITELEAAPPAPVGPNETAVMPDYPGYMMTQRECFQAGAKRAVPDGWVVVPAEPTMEMLDEFDSIIDYGAEDSKDAWGRLIAAAPQQEVKNG
ncbi:hypothetical protein [Enterobacter roggenkampii]|uniref:hypothetical protein n=1 Tax=Enterobacter roggenkampii TaxID=1812935 RepID=UPI001FD7DA9E|nr:hypothetical protein [Enterobacter roggenkampii]UWI98723.1 hypothetical protein N0B38_08700 [Enterobacter roggenkampii]